MSTAVIPVQDQTGGRFRTKARSSAISFLWAAGLGLVSGLACVGARMFFRLLQWIIVRHSGLLPHAAASLTPVHRATVPVLGALIAMAVIAMARRFSGTEEAEGYVEAVRFDHGRIAFAPTFWRTISSGFSVATGAAIGREGSMIQFATAATSWVGSRRTTEEFSLARKVACGVSAAVAAAYQAPIAGVFFAYEIVLGRWDWVQAPELVISSAVGWLVSRLLLGAGPLFAVHSFLPLSKDAVWALPLAALLAVIGPVYQWLLHSFRFLRKLPLPLLWGGLAVGLLSILTPTVWGNGDVALTDTLTGLPVLQVTAAVLLMRLVATTVCTGAGTVGGVFTPTLFTGAALGLTCAHLLHLSEPVLLAVFGLSVFLAAVTHAPWMAAFMAAELTGQWHLFPVFLCLNLGASALAHRISPRALYDIADTPQGRA